MSGTLHVAQIITHLARGGAQATVLASLDDSPTVRHSLLAGPDDPGEGTFWNDDRLRHATVVPIPSLHRRLDPRTDLRCMIALVRWIRREQPDVIHTHSSKPGVLGRIAGAVTRTPVVHTVHGWSFAPLTGRSRAATVFLERLLARCSQTLIVVTTMDRTTGLRERIGSPEMYQVIRSGIDLSISREAARRTSQLRERLGLPTDAPIIGAVARMSEQKRLDDLVTAFGKSGLAREGVHLCIIGDGPLRPQLEDRIQALGIAESTHLTGARTDANEVVSVLDLFVLTSAWEGLPRTIIEAMAAAVPVAATPVGGVTEVIEDGATGWLFDVGDTDRLAAIMREATSEHSDRRLRARRAAVLADEFDEATMRARLHDVWGVARPGSAVLAVDARAS